MKHFQFIFILFFSILIVGCSVKGLRKVCIRKSCIWVEIADTEALRRQGLMGREKLEDKRGMLFIFPVEGQHGFWMKNMRFPLDIIWINREDMIVDIKEDVPVCKDICLPLYPQKPALYVLEVKAGFSRKQRLRIGESVNLF